MTLHGAIITDLNSAQTPEAVARILRTAAQKYRESESELQVTWTDVNAGRVWREHAKILERAATACERAVTKWVS